MYFLRTIIYLHCEVRPAMGGAPQGEVELWSLAGLHEVHAKGWTVEKNQ